MSTSARRSGILLAILVILASSVARAAEVKANIDWPKFMARHDLVWNKVPTKWGEGAFTGDGLLGLMMYTTDDGAGLRFRVGRTDVMIQEKQAYRVPIGDLVLKPVGKITGGNFRQDLWNAEVTGTLKTDKGEIGIRFFTHATDLVNIIELSPSDGEKDCRWEFQPGLSANPRWIRDKQPIPEDEKSPPPETGKRERSGAGFHFPTPPAHYVLQKVFNGDEYATVWTEDSTPETRVLVLSIGYVKKGGSAIQEATDALNLTTVYKLSKIVETHRQWWHAFYPKSFLSVPDTKLESFYWIQLYKLASATRADRRAVDLMGPWYNDTPWPRIWWNLNLQLTYYPVYTANHLELGESLTKMIDAGAENLSKNADTKLGNFSADSETIGRTSGTNCRSPGGQEISNYIWALHNYYMQYRYSMDDAMLRDRLLPRLKRGINYFHHFLKEGDDGKLHLTIGYSPEYPKQPTPNPDANIDLAVLRWGCQTLLDTCARLKIDDPLIPKWKDTLARLTPYPTDENGLRVSASMPWKESHRHYSHLLMIYPLYTMNWDQPENRELIAKSFDHWLSLPSAFRGYSWTGAASISAAIDRPDDAVKYLNEFLSPEGRYKCLPNTHYAEAGPVIETPLSGARALQDILLTSWGNTIRIFPGVPDSWPDVSFHNLRTEGAFLVSAQRRGGKTQFVRVESLAGEPCRVKLDGKVHELKLAKGESIILPPDAAQRDATIEPVPAQPGKTNAFGLP